MRHALYQFGRACAFSFFLELVIECGCYQAWRDITCFSLWAFLAQQVPGQHHDAATLEDGLPAHSQAIPDRHAYCGGPAQEPQVEPTTKPKQPALRRRRR